QAVLAVHLAGVDVALGEDDELLAPGGLLGGRDGWVGQDQEGQPAALRAGAQFAKPDQGGGLGQAAAEVEHLGVARGGPELALLRRGEEGYLRGALHFTAPCEGRVGGGDEEEGEEGDEGGGFGVHVGVPCAVEELSPGQVQYSRRRRGPQGE